MPCDAISRPEPRGFLADGRAVLTQRLPSSGGLVRAWDVTSNELETLLVTEQDASIRLSEDGATIFESFTRTSAEPAFRVHTIADGVVSSGEPTVMPLAAVSGDGGFVLDENLRRFTSAGEPDFDFSVSLPNASGAPSGHVGMSFSGDAIVTLGYTTETLQSVLSVLREDGSVMVLTEPPDLESCWDS